MALAPPTCPNSRCRSDRTHRSINPRDGREMPERYECQRCGWTFNFRKEVPDLVCPEYYQALGFGVQESPKVSDKAG